MRFLAISNWRRTACDGKDFFVFEEQLAPGDTPLRGIVIEFKTK